MRETMRQHLDALENDGDLAPFLGDAIALVMMETGASRGVVTRPAT